MWLVVCMCYLAACTGPLGLETVIASKNSGNWPTLSAVRVGAQQLGFLMGWIVDCCLLLLKQLTHHPSQECLGAPACGWSPTGDWSRDPGCPRLRLRLRTRGSVAGTELSHPTFLLSPLAPWTQFGSAQTLPGSEMWRSYTTPSPSWLHLPRLPPSPSWAGAILCCMDCSGGGGC